MVAKNIKFIFLSLVCVVVVTASSFNQTAYAASASSTIAGIEIEAKDDKKIESQLRAELEVWNQTPVSVVTTYGAVELPPELFVFDTKATVSNYKKRSKTPWYIFWKRTQRVDVPIVVAVDELEVEERLKKNPSIVVLETMERVKNGVASQLAKSVQAAQLDKSVLENKRIAFTSRKYEFSETSFELLPDSLKEFTLQPNEKVSFLQLTESEGEYENPELLTHMASTIYDLLLQTNYEILERHQATVKLDGFVMGTEAQVTRAQGKDLVFMNPNVASGTVKLSLREGRLRAELFSIPINVDVTFFQTDKKHVQPRVITRYSNKLVADATTVLEPGKRGLRVSNYRRITQPSDSFEVEELVSTDFYPPIHRVVLISSQKAPENEPDSSPNNSEGGEAPTDERNSDGTGTSGAGTGGNSTGSGKNGDKGGGKPSENGGSSNGNSDKGGNNSKNNQSGTSNNEKGADSSSNKDGVILDKGGNEIVQ